MTERYATSAAKRLARHLKDKHGINLKHTHALDALAAAAGDKNRHVLLAKPTDTAPKGGLSAAALAQLRRAANAYADLGRGFPLTGIGNLLDLLDDLEANPPEPKKPATRKGGAVVTTSSDTVLRTAGDRAVYSRTDGWGVQVVRTKEGLVVDLVDPQGEVTETSTLWFSDPIDEHFGDEAEDLFEIDDQPHAGEDRITLALDGDGEATVSVGAVFRITLSGIQAMDTDGPADAGVSIGWSSIIDGNGDEADLFTIPAIETVGLDPTERLHAADNEGVDYGDEVAVRFETGRELRIGAGDEVNHLRVVQNGREVAYWSTDEFREDAADVLGAAIGALNGGATVHAVTGARLQTPLTEVCHWVAVTNSEGPHLWKAERLAEDPDGTLRAILAALLKA